MGTPSVHWGNYLCFGGPLPVAVWWVSSGSGFGPPGFLGGAGVSYVTGFSRLPVTGGLILVSTFIYLPTSWF